MIPSIWSIIKINIISVDPLSCLLLYIILQLIILANKELIQLVSVEQMEEAAAVAATTTVINNSSKKKERKKKAKVKDR